MSIELGMPESVRDKVDELIAAYVKHAGKQPDLLRMNVAMYHKLCEECGMDNILPDNFNGVARPYNGIVIGIVNRMPEGVVDAGEWA